MAFRSVFVGAMYSVLRNIPRKPSVSRCAMRRRNGSRSAIEDLEWFKSADANKACEEKKAERGARS